MEEKTLDVAGYKCQTLINRAEGTPIVFLHGLSYTIEVWQRIGVIDLLVEKKVPFLALDMPYGLKSQCQPKSRDPQVNVNFTAETVQSVFGDAAPVVVGASLGGYIALNYAAKHPVKGLLLIAPAYAFENMDLVWKYANFHFPVRIVWGANDSIISSEELRALDDKLPNAKLLVYNGAAHSAYQDRPEWFRTDLLKLYASATI
ncbi:MAG: alpha/beta fold hydrolase [Candidatus Bathyarchaeia archaeon]|jgi:pimeloyl-ACP methyl ester carboxylesterase